MKSQNEQFIIVGTPSCKIISFITIIIGIALLIITIVTGWSDDDLSLIMYLISPVIIVGGIFLFVYSIVSSITVTNLRVYGKSLFGKRVDLPFDMISAVGSVGFWHGISVSTASGVIRFMYIKNYAQIHSIIVKIMLDRQNSKQVTEHDFFNADIMN